VREYKEQTRKAAATRKRKAEEFYRAQLFNSIRNVVYGHEGLVPYRVILRELNAVVREVKELAQSDKPINA
jgi:hypothetical protein